MTELVEEEALLAMPASPRAPGRWLMQGLRTALLMRCDWTGLRPTPGLAAGFVLAVVALGIVAGRLAIDGPADFQWQGLLDGWMSAAFSAWCCWLLVPRERAAPAGTTRAPDAAALFTMMCAQSLIVCATLFTAAAAAARLGYQDDGQWGDDWLWWLPPTAWIFSSQALLAWRGASVGTARRSLVVAILLGVAIIDNVLYPQQYWVAPEPAAAEDAAPLEVTQELMELQPKLLANSLDALAPQRPGVVDVYAITYAPYATQDVFMRESAMVAGVMERRFDAAGRTVQLVNNDATANKLPWATPLNLKRTIERMAGRMNRDEDVLFIHLTSHGGADGDLATDFPPLTVDDVTPQDLETWLDDAGVRYRVISVSACFSGSWITPLVGDGTLVMTAADADHTSYGCGSRSDLTFFGKAMYDEQLRNQTWSFEKAHAAARLVIERREKEAGKTDGYSNPQISVGKAIHRQLVLLEAQHAASAALNAK